MGDVFSADRNDNDSNEPITRGVNFDDVRDTSSRIVSDKSAKMPITIE